MDGAIFAPKSHVKSVIFDTMSSRLYGILSYGCVFRTALVAKLFVLLWKITSFSWLKAPYIENIGFWKGGCLPNNWSNFVNTFMSSCLRVCVILLAANMCPKLDQLTKQYFWFCSGQRGTIFFMSFDNGAPLSVKKRNFTNLYSNSNTIINYRSSLSSLSFKYFDKD